jgi:Fic family protein
MDPIIESHPWIKFSVNLKEADPQMWLLLGEAQSKCEHIAGVPLKPATAQKMHQIYLAKGVNATTAIEGNTLTEEQVLERVEGKLNLPRSKEYLQQEVDNIIVACNEVWAWVKDGRTKLEAETINTLNGMILKNLPPEEEEIPGALRKHNVGIQISRYRGVPWQRCPEMVDRLCAWLNDFQDNPQWTIALGLVRAILAHIYIAWIHPYGNGNGRTARMIEYFFLLQAGVPTPAAHLLSNHYNQTRSDYYRQLDMASKSGGDVFPFIRYALQGFVDGLVEQLATIRQQQYDISWRDYVHEQFSEMDKSAAHRRMRHLVLDLSKKRSPVPLAEIREVSGRVTEDYLRKTAKTITRDLRKITEMGLIRKTKGGYVPNKATILAFLPARHDKSQSGF